MTEPTYKQHKILEDVEAHDGVRMTGKEYNIELYWQLVRSGYLKNLVTLTGIYEWKFILTEEAEEYLAKIKDMVNNASKTMFPPTMHGTLPTIPITDAQLSTQNSGFPYDEIITEGCFHHCSICHSTMSKTGFMKRFGKRRCDNKKCPNSKK